MKNHTIKLENNISVVRFSNSPSLKDIKDAIDELSMAPTQLRLWDLSEGINLSKNEIQEIAEYGKLKFTSPAKIAILAPSDLAFALSRMHEVYRDQDIIEEKVFRNENKAIEWLRKGAGEIE